MVCDPNHRNRGCAPIELQTALGVDVGLKSLVALSDSTTIEYPRYYVQDKARLNVAQRNLSRKKKESANRRKAEIRVASSISRSKTIV